MSGEQSIPAQLGRRRAAADRLPPLESGERDPIDGMTSRSPYPRSLRRSEYRAASVTLDEDRGVMLVKGRSVADVLRRYDLKPLWSAAGAGWCLDAHHVSDVLAMLTAHGFRVHYREAA